MRERIPLIVKKTCCQMKTDGKPVREIYDEYYTKQTKSGATFTSFKRLLNKWSTINFPDETTLECGTYEGFTAHDATVQVSANGEIIQAWIKQKASDFNPEDFLSAIRETVEPYNYKPKKLEKASRMLEIPLFDMHWGVNFMDHYKPVLDEILEIIDSRNWDEIVIPFGQDFFHNDSIVNGQTTKGTAIEKVDMIRAVKEGRQFMTSIINAALAKSNNVRVTYSPGNHDLSISWMFVQVLLEIYGSSVVDDSLEYRKVITYGNNAIMVTHGDSRKATPHTLAHVFPIMFPNEFGKATVREVHAGHLHHESEADIYGVMVRRLSTGSKIDDWSNKEDHVGAHRRFMIFEWDTEKLKSIHYI